MDARAPIFATLGCRLNAYETEAMRELSAAAGLDNAVIVNTCAVTAEAVRKAKQEIRRLRRENPDAALIVTGCAAQTEPETFAEMPEVTRVIGNHEKMQAETWRSLRAPDFVGQTEKVMVDDIMSVRETAGHLIDGFGRHRAYVQVQNGCDHRCTFCIIPYGRGNSRSVPAVSLTDMMSSTCTRSVSPIRSGAWIAAQVAGCIFSWLPMTRATSGMAAKVSGSVCAAQPVTMTGAPGFSRDSRRISWRALRTASAVTAQVFTITAPCRPAASAISRIASVS